MGEEPLTLTDETCVVCGRTAPDVAWRQMPLAPRARWLCTDEAACFAAYREGIASGR